MKKAIFAAVLALGIGCGFGEEEQGEAPADASVVEVDAGVEQDVELQAAPKEDAFRASQVPFGPAPASTSNCQCGVGCHMTLAPDGQGYYCEYVCVACP